MRLIRHAFSVAVVFAVLALPAQATDYVIEPPLGGHCEDPLGGSWNAATNTCSFLKFVLSAADTLAIQPSINVHVAGTLTNDGRIINGGVLVNHGVTNHGTVENLSGGTLENNGPFENIGELYNDSIIANWGDFNNSGTLDNGIDGTVDTPVHMLSNSSSGTIRNFGIFDTEFMLNQGTINSFGVIYNDGAFNNNGTINNSGAIVSFLTLLSNNSPGIINNHDRIFVINGDIDNFGTLNSDGIIINSGDIHNSGTIDNVLGGTIDNFPGSSFNNDGILDNHGTVSNNGYLDNRIGSTLTNFGSLINESPGTLDNDSTLINRGSLDNRGTLTNDGTLSNNDTIVNVVNIENSGNIDNSRGTILNLCFGAIVGNPVLGNQPTTGVLLENIQGNTFSWCEVPGAVYQVALGDLELLTGSGGDFAQATGECLLRPSTSLIYRQTPDSGGGVWLLVRPADGTYDTGGAGQVESRDDEIAAVLACP